MDSAFTSRRSTVYSSKGMVSSTQPLANAAGVKIMTMGGNCVDACVAISACLCVLEPSSTGIGGDCFSLFYKNSEKKVFGLNGTGRSASALNIDWLRENHPDHILPTLRFKEDSVFKVQIPGAIAGWCDAIEKWGSGKVTLSEILQPAIDLCEDGFVVSQVSAKLWQGAEKKLLRENEKSPSLSTFLPNENFSAPVKGQYLKNEALARTLRLISQSGKKAFYEGEIAESIVKELSSRGSLISLEDMAHHTSTTVEPISISMLGQRLWEIPPNGSGVIALLTLGLIEQLESQKTIDLKSMKHNSAEYLHLVIECLKLSFKDSDEYVNDYEYFTKNHNLDQSSNLESLLKPQYLKSRAQSFSKDKIMDNKNASHGIPNPMFKSDTVYFCATDSEGNACSFINSLYENFGSGIMVPDRGFVLQNRGGNFNLNPKSKNCLAGNKRSYHTIIPGMITTESKSGLQDLYATYGIMGGYNQPQAHVQIYLNLLLFGMDPQAALDAPRITMYPHPDFKHTDLGLGSDGPASVDVTCVGIEEGIDPTVFEQLQKMGHHVKVLKGDKRGLCGRGQIIRKETGPETMGKQVYSGGSDPRGDGASLPLV